MEPGQMVGRPSAGDVTENENDLDGYQILKRMGEGAQGRIFLVREKPEEGGSKKKEWVMKMVSLPSKFPETQQYEDAIREGSTMQYLHHPCVVSCKESFVHDQQTLCIVMEHCKGGDLCTRIRQQLEVGQDFSEDLVLDWLVQTLLALEYLHKQRILHRDIKSENIFLHQPASGGPQVATAQLGDFGIARILDTTDALASTFVGTPYYMSPELFKGKPYNYKTDVWALGCVLYELLCLRQPFRAKNFPDLAAEVTRGLYPPISTSYSSDIRNVVACMLTLDPLRRPLAGDLLELPFLKSRAQAFVTLHANTAAFQTRRAGGRHSVQNLLDMYHSLRDQARRLRILPPSQLRESETETETSSGPEPFRERPPRLGNEPVRASVDLYPRTDVPYPVTPRFAEWPPRERDTDWSPSPPPEPRARSVRPGALSDPPPVRSTPLYRPIPVRAMPLYPKFVRFDPEGRYVDGPGKLHSEGGGRTPGSWSLLHRPAGTGAGSAPVWTRENLRTSGDELTPSGSSPEDNYGGGGETGWMAEVRTPLGWESGGMDYYGEGLSNSRDLRDMREARVKRRGVVIAQRARRSPRSPPRDDLADSLDQDPDLEDEEQIMRVFPVDVSSSSYELDAEGYEVIAASAPVEEEPPCCCTRRGSVSDGSQVSKNWPSDADMGPSCLQRPPLPRARFYMSDGKQSAFSTYRRPPQSTKSYQTPCVSELLSSRSHVPHQAGKSPRDEGTRPHQPQHPRPETATHRKPARKVVSYSAPPLPPVEPLPFKSPSPPIGPPPTKSLRPAVFVRSRRAVSLPNPSSDPSPLEASDSKATAAAVNSGVRAADLPQPGSRPKGHVLESHPLQAELAENRVSDSGSASPEEGFEGEMEGGNGSSGGLDSNNSSGGASSTEARSASSSGTAHGGSGSSSSMSCKDFDSLAGGGWNEPTRRGGVSARRERGPRDGSSGNTSASEYVPSKTRGRSVKEVGGGFVIQYGRHHSDGERALAHEQRVSAGGSDLPPKSFSKARAREAEGNSAPKEEGAQYGAVSGRKTPASNHPEVRHSHHHVSATPAASEGPPEVPVQRVQRPLAREQSLPNKAFTSEGAQPSDRHSLGGPVSEQIGPRAFSRGAAYYSDGGDDWNEPTTPGHVAGEEKRRKGGLRPRGLEHPLCGDRTDGRARFEYDFAHMHEGPAQAQKYPNGGSQKHGVNSIGTQASAYKGQLLSSTERESKRGSTKEAGGVEWWRLPPISAPQEGERQIAITSSQRTAMVLS